MKKSVLFSLCLLLYVSNAFAQQKVFTFQVLDSASQSGLLKVHCKFVVEGKTQTQAFSDSSGKLQLSIPEGKTGNLLFRKAFYKPFYLPLAAELPVSMQTIFLAPLQTNLQEVVVRPFQVQSTQPITASTIQTDYIKKNYYGADIPALINRTPGINMYSDAGNGIGYSYFRLRGIDQSRINMSVNGIPVNDPENQGFFVNNFADLAASARSIQIQRGVGLSTNGTSAFGGAIQLTTKSLEENPGVEIASGFGSFGASRLMAQFQSGRLGKNLAFSGRFSNIRSNGYRQNSGTDIQSYFFSAAYFGKNSVLKINLFGGATQSKLAYLGIEKKTLDTNRRFNPFSNGESDAFQQHFAQLQYTAQLSSQWTFQASAYSVQGKAPRFQYLFPSAWGYPLSWFNMPPIGTDSIAGNMMTSYRLKQSLLGAYFSLEKETEKHQTTMGMHANHFTSDHFMEINWGEKLPATIGQNHLVYFNTGTKKEFSAFLRRLQKFSSVFHWFTEAQFRTTAFDYKERKMAIRPSFGSVQDMSWAFVNFKTGINYQLKPNTQLYLVLGQSSREPTRIDYFQDDFATRQNIRQTDLKYETVRDAEAGIKLSTTNLQLQANGFYMQFINQIVGTGQLNAFGTPINTNVARSTRFGLELDMNWKISKHWSLSNQSALMQSRIGSFAKNYSFSDYSGDTTFTLKNKPALLTPNLILNQGLRFAPTDWLAFNLMGRNTSEQFLDNSGDAALQLPSFWFADFSAAVNLSRWIKQGTPVLTFFVNNFTNASYSTAGNVAAFSNFYDPQTNSRQSTALYFPAARRNWFVSLNWAF